MVNRIKQLLEKKKLTAAQFAGEVGVQRSAVSHLLSGRNKPSLDFILKIKNRFPEVNLDWLLLGDGKMIEKAPPQETGVENLQKDLFRGEMDARGVKENPAESTVKEPEIAINVAKSEDAPAYRRAGAEPGQPPQKVVLLYPDHTFKIFDAR
ncbi:MAG: helix-turn-helix domain-containing protein [Bacteroidales bacterium]|nr:helix-turn-helix domain-containing protein [Bacteroidales bacterium]MCF6342546.1 helix-turn-helix domain-containing protein [Bacteroidales bacterium]